jgi:hypothetical protein
MALSLNLNGATTISMMTLVRMPLGLFGSIATLCIQSKSSLIIAALSVAFFVIPSVVLPSVVMLNVVAPLNES